MDDSTLDALLGGLPFRDENQAPDDASLRAWRAGETKPEVIKALTGSAAARALLQTLDKPADRFTVERLRNAVFPPRRRWIMPAVAAVVLAAGLLFFVARPGPTPDYHAPTWGGTSAPVRSPVAGAPTRLVYPPTGKIRMTLRPKRSLKAAPGIAVYMLDANTLHPVEAAVQALENGVYEVQIEVSALPGTGPRSLTLYAVLGDDAGGFANADAVRARADRASRWFTGSIEIEGGADAP